MLSQKKVAETVFNEFSIFLKNTELINREFDEKVQDEFKIIHDLFKRKIHRCEVVDSTIFPSQIIETDIIFELLFEKIQCHLAENGPYLKLKKLIVKEVLKEFKTCNKVILSTEILLESVYDAFFLHYFNDRVNNINYFDVSYQIIRKILNDSNYFYPDEIFNSLHTILYKLLKGLIQKGISSKEFFIKKALEQFRKRNLISQMFICDVLTNLSYNCLNFLINKRYIRFKRGLVDTSERKLKKGIKKFSNKMTSVLKSFPVFLRDDLINLSNKITEELKKLIKKDITEELKKLIKK